jgi:membrane protein
MSFEYSGRGETVVQFVADVVHEYRENDLPFMAGSIAYSTFVSLFPLVVLLVIAASTLGGDRMVEFVRRVTANYLMPAGQTLLADSLGHTGGQTSLSFIGLVVLLWGVMRVFLPLDTAFSKITRPAGGTRS